MQPGVPGGDRETMIGAVIAESPERAKLHDFAWYRTQLKIQDRATHRMVPLRPTLIQQKVRDAILAAEKERRPGRLIILKARREGVSTIIQATFAHRAFTRNHVKAYTIADESDSASNLFGMTEQMWANLPRALQPKKGPGSGAGRRLVLASGSDLRTETAQDKHAGRSGSATLVHASEFAFWPYPSETLTAMLQIVPDEVGTLVVIESTANGVGNTFHDEWLRASEGDSAYVPLFFSWLDDPGYFRKVEEYELGELDDEEQALKEVYGASLGQLNWRRHKIRQDLKGRVEDFHQEYPTTAEEAFLATGRQFFGAPAIARFRPAEPIGRYSLAGMSFRKKGDRPRKTQEGPLWIYELPKPNTRYLLFVDPAGVVADMRAKHFSDPKDVEDFTCMWVVNCSSMATAAVWHSRIDIGLAGAEAASLGAMYNRAVLCAETSGGYGFVLTAKWREMGYAPIHRDRERNKYDRSAKAIYGFATSVATRPLMLETLRDILREQPELLRHEGLKKEMMTFVTVRNFPAAAAGCHDDCVMAAAGAYAVAPDYAQRKPISSTLPKRKKHIYEDVLTRAQRKRRID